MFGNVCWSVTAGRICLLVLSAAGPMLFDMHFDPAGLNLPQERAADIIPLITKAPTDLTGGGQ